jgi:hypothetical protein
LPAPNGASSASASSTKRAPARFAAPSNCAKVALPALASLPTALPRSSPSLRGQQIVGDLKGSLMLEA